MDEIVLSNGRRTTRIAFGCGGLGGATGWNASRRLLGAAWDAGIRHFDVAPSYGFGEAEQFLGRAIREFGAAATVTTKVGIGRGTRPGRFGQLLRNAARTGLAAVPAMRRKLGDRMRAAAPRGQFETGLVRASVEESLRALGRDHIDVLLLHEAVASDLSPELLELLEQLQREGKIGSAGVGSRTESLMAMAWPLPAPLSVAQGVWRLDGEHLVAPPGVTMNRHGVLHNLPQLQSLLQSHPALAADMTDRTGISCTEPRGVASLLMALALGEPGCGLLIAQSRNPVRVTELANARALPSASEILAELRGMI